MINADPQLQDVGRKLTVVVVVGWKLTVAVVVGRKLCTVTNH